MDRGIVRQKKQGARHAQAGAPDEAVRSQRGCCPRGAPSVGRDAQDRGVAHARAACVRLPTLRTGDLTGLPGTFKLPAHGIVSLRAASPLMERAG